MERINKTTPTGADYHPYPEPEPMTGCPSKGYSSQGYHKAV